MFKKNEEAVSPVIGVILMVAITVILATVVALFGFGFAGDFGGANPKGPTSSIQIGNVPDTPEVDMMIVHKGGDTLKAGDWRISIVPAGQPPVYQTSSTDFRAGDQIITYNLTSGTGNYTVTNSSVYTTGTAGILDSSTKYDIKIIVYPFKSMVVDAVVVVR